MLSDELIKKTFEEKAEFVRKRRKELEKTINKKRLRELEKAYKRAERSWKRVNKKKEKPLAVPIPADLYEMMREDNVFRRLSKLHSSV